MYKYINMFHVYIDICIWIYVYISVFICMYICIHTYTHTHITSTHTHTTHSVDFTAYQGWWFCTSLKGWWVCTFVKGWWDAASWTVNWVHDWADIQFCPSIQRKLSREQIGTPNESRSLSHMHTHTHPPLTPPLRFSHITWWIVEVSDSVEESLN